jgi:hypothetical protein
MLILLNYPYFFKVFQVSDKGKGDFTEMPANVPPPETGLKAG